MKILITLVLLAICSTSAVAQQPDSAFVDPNPDNQTLVDRGLQAEYRQHYEAARGFYERAMANRSKAGIRRLGLLYEAGLGVPKDLNKARELYLMAGDRWAFDCLCTLNMSAGNGPGALEWCTKAAESDIPLAKLNLGALFRDGMDPILADRAKALFWLRQITDDKMFGFDAREMIETFSKN